MAMSINLSRFDRSGDSISVTVYVPMPDWNAGFSIVVSLEQKSAFADLIVDHLLALIVLLEHREELHDVRILQARFSERHYKRNVLYTYVPVELITRPIEAQNNCASIVGRWDHGVIIDSRAYRRCRLTFVL